MYTCKNSTKNSPYLATTIEISIGINYIISSVDQRIASRYVSLVIHLNNTCSLDISEQEDDSASSGAN